MKDYYELLEVSKNASEDTIKKVFRMLIKKNHPDLFEGEEKTKAEEKVKQLNEAYAILSNKEKREAYNTRIEESNVNTDIAIETLIKENEYLKSVIQEKNRLIKEYFDELEIDTSKITNDFEDYEEDYETDDTLGQDNLQNKAFDLYKSKQRMKQIIHMTLMIIVGIIVLKVVTGIDIFKIFIEVFKNMF